MPALSWLLPLLLGLSTAAAIADTDIVARVNNTAITRKAVNDVVEGALSLKRDRASEIEVRRLRAAALDSLIELELLYQAGATLGLSVTDTDVDEEVSRNRGLFPDEKSFAEALALRGMTADDLRQDTRKMMLVDRYLEQKVWRDIEISPEDVATFYHENREQFRRPARVRASHILVRVSPSASDAERRKAQAKALDLLSQVRNGGDFAKLARRYSEDQATAPNGGDLGFFARGTMVDAFERPLFSLMPGQTAELIETDYGFHVVKVTDRQLAGARSLDDVRDSIRELLTKRERRRLQADRVAQLRAQATIEIYDPTLRAEGETSR